MLALLEHTEDPLEAGALARYARTVAMSVGEQEFIEHMEDALGQGWDKGGLQLEHEEPDRKVYDIVTGQIKTGGKCKAILVQ